VAGLYFVYEAMEDAFDTTADPYAPLSSRPRYLHANPQLVSSAPSPDRPPCLTCSAVKALDYDSLRRKASLEADMEYYYGADWQASVTPSAATRRYVERIREVAKDEPTLLIAHQYTRYVGRLSRESVSSEGAHREPVVVYGWTEADRSLGRRYLGDLFGGQMMGGMATRTLGLAEGKGIEFYQFPAIPDNKAFIEEWYGALNELPLTPEQKQAIVDEANLVFAFNIELFSELDGNALQAMFALAWSSLKEKLGLDTVE